MKNVPKKAVDVKLKVQIWRARLASTQPFDRRRLVLARFGLAGYLHEQFKSENQPQKQILLESIELYKVAFAVNKKYSYLTPKTELFSYRKASLVAMDLLDLMRTESEGKSQEQADLLFQMIEWMQLVLKKTAEEDLGKLVNFRYLMAVRLKELAGFETPQNAVALLKQAFDVYNKVLSSSECKKEWRNDCLYRKADCLYCLVKVKKDAHSELKLREALNIMHYLLPREKPESQESIISFIILLLHELGNLKQGKERQHVFKLCIQFQSLHSF